MPVSCAITFPRLSEAEMRDIDYRVMGHAFEIHRELGCLCDESVGLTPWMLYSLGAMECWGVFIVGLLRQRVYFLGDVGPLAFAAETRLD
jgi:hypothetical protein